MKRIATLFVAGVSLLLAASAMAAVKTSAFRVEGMKNDAAIQRVTQAVKAVPGVQDAVGDAGSGVLMVRYDTGKAGAMDISEAVSAAGYTLGSVDVAVPGGPVSKENTNQKAKGVLTDFAQVLDQTKEFLDKDRYGIVRNLAPAMKIRSDAVLTFEQGAKGATGTANTYQLAQNLSKAVADFATSADAKDKAAVKAKFANVKQAFKALADARNFEELVAPAVATQGQSGQKSIQDMLKEYVTKVFGGK